MNNHKWLKVSEYVCLGLSILGIIVATVTQQVAYGFIPLCLSMTLNLVNRPQFNYSQLQTNLQNTDEEFDQLNKTMNTYNQRLEQIETWRQQLSQIIDQKIEIAINQSLGKIETYKQEISQIIDEKIQIPIQKLSTEFNAVNQEIQIVNNRLQQLDTSLENLSSHLEKDEYLNNIAELKTELSSLNQQIQVFNSRFTEIDNSTEKLHQTISENNQEISEIKQKQEIETSQNHHILDVITQQLTKLDALTELDNLFTALVQPLQVENKLNLQPKPIMEETSKKIEEIKEISQINNLDSIENSLNKSWEKLDVLRGLNTLFNPLQIENESNLQPKDNDQETAETLELTPPKSLIDEKTGKLVFFNNLKTHKNKVLSVAFSPNGKLLASGSDDKIIILWDLATKKYSILEGHGDGEYGWSRGINSIAFSPDSQFLISGSDDKTIKLWDINLRLAIFTFIGHEKKVYAVAFSPLGKLIASGSKDKTVRMWSLETGKEIYSFQGHTDEVLCVAFSPDGKLLASGAGGHDKTIKILVLAENQVKTLRGHSD
ncbi:MAG: hypothetical protein ACKOQS_10435, partial [Dolichospermum sp.]